MSTRFTRTSFAAVLAGMLLAVTSVPSNAAGSPADAAAVSTQTQQRLSAAAVSVQTARQRMDGTTAAVTKATVAEMKAWRVAAAARNLRAHGRAGATAQATAKFRAAVAASTATKNALKAAQANADAFKQAAAGYRKAQVAAASADVAFRTSVANPAGLTVRTGYVMPVAAPPGVTWSLDDGFASYTGHTGMDFNVVDNTPIYAVADGTVTNYQEFPGEGQSDGFVSYGRLIEIKHVDGTVTRYAHLTSSNVRTGDKVRVGQQIGLSGHYGHVIPTGPAGAHLHFEVLVDGQPVEPLTWLANHHAAQR